MQDDRFLIVRDDGYAEIFAGVELILSYRERRHNAAFDFASWRNLGFDLQGIGRVHLQIGEGLEIAAIINRRSGVVR